MKKCFTCKKEKSVSEFYKRASRKSGVASSCIECDRQYRKKHYSDNSSYYKKKARRISILLIEKNINRVISYLREHLCVDCGEKDIVVLQFDHVRGKKVKAVSYMVYNCYSWERIKREIEKCDVRCANCHIRKTANSFNWKKSRI